MAASQAVTGADVSMLVSRPVPAIVPVPAGKKGSSTLESHRARSFVTPAWHDRVKALEADVLEHGAGVLLGNSFYTEQIRSFNRNDREHL